MGSLFILSFLSQYYTLFYSQFPPFKLFYFSTTAQTKNLPPPSLSYPWQSPCLGLALSLAKRSVPVVYPCWQCGELHITLQGVTILRLTMQQCTTPPQHRKLPRDLARTQHYSQKMEGGRCVGKERWKWVSEDVWGKRDGCRRGDDQANWVCGVRRLLTRWICRKRDGRVQKEMRGWKKKRGMDWEGKNGKIRGHSAVMMGTETHLTATSSPHPHPRFHITHPAPHPSPTFPHLSPKQTHQPHPIPTPKNIPIPYNIQHHNMQTH